MPDTTLNSRESTEQTNSYLLEVYSLGGVVRKMVNFFLKYILETNMYNMSGDSKCYGNNFKMKQGLRHAGEAGRVTVL